ncbi:dicarboxylate/amino acid:cation symporter [uncultured Campylobacter sp.]|uniref:dicarboxylate/amino acid:cation symporter n=1 Tax=uncultured Campylobacter sp. TaxID=218934 RepID=UPI0028E440D3|nr:dicarboxylate/amino acid:cation symporter [uncultured Campylobacter sp.]
MEADVKTVKSKSLIRRYFEINLLYKILAGLILGVIFGAVFQNATGAISVLEPFGDIFIRLLKMIIVPIVTASLIVGCSSIAPSDLGRVGAKVLLFYLATSFFAILIGLGVGIFLEPGAGLGITGTASAQAKAANAPSMSQILVNLFPTNPIEAMAKGEILQIITFSLFFGVALSFVKDSKDERLSKLGHLIYDVFDGINHIMFKVVGWIMQYAPIGVFALIFIVFSKQGVKAFGPLLGVTISTYIGFIAHVALIFTLACLAIKISPLKFLNKVKSPMITAFVTRSSGGTLPISMKTADEDMGIPRQIYGFALPVGATVNMNGTIIYLGICAIFIANAVGVQLDMGAKLTIILTAVLAAVGTAGVPGAGAIMLLMVLESVGLKVESGSAVAAAYALILGIDAILDMGRTSLNVGGDMLGAVFVAKNENSLDMSKWE